VTKELKSGHKHHHSTAFARRGLSDLLHMKTSHRDEDKPYPNSPKIEGSGNLKALLHRPRHKAIGVSQNINEINNSFSSKGNGSITLSDEISDPSSDSETMSCFRGSLSRHGNSTSARRSNLSTTHIKRLRSQPRITVMLNENLQCVIKLDGAELQQIARLTKRYNLSISERKKLTTLVEKANRGGRLDHCKSPGF
jgi:hypothetical protein